MDREWRVAGDEHCQRHAWQCLTQSEELGVGQGRTGTADVSDVALVHALVLVSIGLDVEEGDAVSRHVDPRVQTDARHVAGSKVPQSRLVRLGVEVDSLPLIRDVLAPGQEVDLATLIKIHFTWKGRLITDESSRVMNSAVSEFCF